MPTQSNDNKVLYAEVSKPKAKWNKVKGILPQNSLKKVGSLMKGYAGYH